MTWNFTHELSRFGPSGYDTQLSLEQCRRYCAQLTRNHYENFSVVSFLLPRSLKPHFEAVYAYCRWSDDLADETGPDSTRLLDWWQNELLAAKPDHPVIRAVQDTIQRFQMPLAPFLDLLSAFQQDQILKEYQTWEQLLDYCRRSANPVGRIVLHLFCCATPEREQHSDNICTGLQLANFWQDVARDLIIGRVYIPRQELERFQLSTHDLQAKTNPDRFRELMRSLVQRTQGYFESGPELLRTLPWRARMNIGVFHRGGQSVLDAIHQIGYDVLTTRPVVSKRSKLSILLQSVWSSFARM